MVIGPLQKAGCIYSLGKRYKLCYRLDGSLAATNESGEQFWSNRALHAAGVCKLQRDCNFACYDLLGRLAWETNTMTTVYKECSIHVSSDRVEIVSWDSAVVWTSLNS